MITTELLTSPLAQSIGWSLLHLVWQGVIVSALLGCTLQLMRSASANSRYVLSCLGLATMLVLPIATALRIYSSRQTVSVTQPANAMPRSDAVTRDVARGDVANSGSLQASEPSSLLPDSATAIHLLDRSLPLVLALWAAGVILFSMRLFAGWMRVESLVRSAVAAAGAESDERLRRLAGRMQLGRAVRMVRSALVEVPTVIGAVRPIILLPIAAMSGMNSDQIEMILAHELAHIRRNDYFVNIVQSVIETLFFYHPAVWWVSRQVRIERENCCDDLAVSFCGDPLRYALALTELEHLRSSSLAVAANGGSLHSRIRRLAGCRVNSRNFAPTWVTGVATIGALALVLVILPTPLLARRVSATPEAPDAPQTAPAASAAPAPPITATPATAAAPRAATSASTMEVSATPAVAPVPDEDESGDSIDMPIVPIDEMIAPLAPMDIPSVRIAPIVLPRIHGNPAVLTPAIREGIAEALARSMDAIDLSSLDAAQREAVDGALRHERAPRPRARMARAGGIGWGDARTTEIKSGPGPLSVDELITLSVSGVTPEYVKEMNSLGLGDLSLNDLLEMRVQGVTPEFVRSLGALGILERSPSALINLRVHGVSAEYVRDMRQLGFGNASTSDLIELRDQGVTSSWVKGMSDAGYNKLSPADLKTLRAHGVSAAYVQSLSQAGYRSLSVNDLVRLRDHGVTADFLAAAKESGYGNLSLDDIIRLRSRGVSAAFLREMAKMKK